VGEVLFYFIRLLLFFFIIKCQQTVLLAQYCLRANKEFTVSFFNTYLIQVRFVYLPRLPCDLTFFESSFCMSVTVLSSYLDGDMVESFAQGSQQANLPT